MAAAATRVRLSLEYALLPERKRRPANAFRWHVLPTAAADASSTPNGASVVATVGKLAKLLHAELGLTGAPSAKVGPGGHCSQGHRRPSR